jgi:hypothetical protein
MGAFCFRRRTAAPPIVPQGTGDSRIGIRIFLAGNIWKRSEIPGFRHMSVAVREHFPRESVGP